ncbi:MAG: 6-carboxytetrahydropterin synthase [Longimonas sp.]|uniref:6-pyruvoyl trahydropterin synthase family protein n=1 Tax=Longimonas sp. TaxID=2039626 RepID=UPI00334B2771
MYTLTVKDDLIAQHYLTVPNCGPENEWHSHHFEIEIILESEDLNKWGYVCDIDDVKNAIDDIKNRFSDKTLNEIEAFAGLNPSVEHFARIAAEDIRNSLDDETRARCHTMHVRIWEDQEAAAQYTTTLSADA